MPALSAETRAANGTDFASWRECEVHTRSTFNILSLCVSTLVICVWNAVHPDVPNPETPRWRVYRMRIYRFLIGLFLPELLVLNALHQFLDARQFLQEMNAPQSDSSFFTISYWTKLLKGMYARPLTTSYWTEAWRPDVSLGPTQPQWTMTQAFYAGMRAFHAKPKSDRAVTLSAEDIKNLCKTDKRNWALFTANAIKDHSKAGALEKALFCWQLLVFAISCIARQAEHLPLSLLEITTLAHSMCGLAAFALWWHKPHSVNEVTVVPIEDSEAEKLGWGGRMPKEKSMVRGLDIVANGEGDALAKAVLSSLAVVALYGLPHLLGLRTEFPNLAERRCWQVATAIIISTPVFLVPLGIVHGRIEHLHGPFHTTVDALFNGAFAVYCMASCFIIAESFRQLFALPSGAFLAPALVCYLPHFS